MRKLLVALALFVSVFSAGMVLAPQSASAASAAECTGNGSIPFLPKWYKYLPHSWDDATQSCVIDADFPSAIPAILMAIFEIILRITGVIAVVFVVYGGFQYLTSTGEPDKAKNARTTIINALVGLIIAIFATAIVNLIARNIA